MYEQIFAPLDLYVNELKFAHEKNVRDYFSLLVEHANVDGVENEKTVAAYDKQTAEIAKRENSVKGKKKLRTFGIIATVLLFLALLVVWSSCIRSEAGKAALIALSLGFSIFAICMICKKINKLIANLSGEIRIYQEKADMLLHAAQAQTASLNALFRDTDALNLATKTLPCLSFDKLFTKSRLMELANGYDYFIRSSLDECMVDVLSGELFGNPFLYESCRIHTLGTHTYHGSLTIHWTTRERDSQGNMVTRSHSQTLHASVTRPCPYYDVSTKLHYGHDAAPELCFSRTGKHAEDKSEAALRRTIKSGEKRLQRLTEKSLKEGGNFTEMLNTEFEVLFGATNRNDELQFRYIFSPNAQEEMLKLMLWSDGYGDDFDFRKYKKCNTIWSEHTQANGISTPAWRYYSHSLALIKKKFYDFNNEFFKSVYFDFAPLLTISSYQQPLVRNAPMQDGELTAYNFELLAARLEGLSPYNAQTQVIYKTSLIKKEGEEYVVDVTAYAYTTEERVHYESVHGDDGCWHNVPVYWIEYIPLRKHSVMLVVPQKEGEEPNFQKPHITYRGMHACIL